MDYKRAWEELKELCLERENAYYVYKRGEKLQELKNIIGQMKDIEEKGNTYMYREIFLDFCNYTRRDRIFLDNDGEVIKSKWEKIINKWKR